LDLLSDDVISNHVDVIYLIGGTESIETPRALMRLHDYVGGKDILRIFNPIYTSGTGTEAFAGRAKVRSGTQFFGFLPSRTPLPFHSKAIFANHFIAGGAGHEFSAVSRQRGLASVTTSSVRFHRTNNNFRLSKISYGNWELPRKF
jgi:hypothetical protein